MSRLKKLVVATMASMALGLSAAAVPATADYGQPCASGSAGTTAGNRQWNGTNDSVYGVRSVINPILATFRQCSLTESSTLFGASSAWIAIVPAPGNPEYDDEVKDDILQSGIVRCNHSTLPVCDANTIAHFWARGGCNGFGPQGLWISWTNDNQHTHEIRHYSSPESGYEIYIDGSPTGKTIDVDQTSVECWLGDRHGAMYKTETWDSGDGIADDDAQLIFSSVAWRITDTGTWQAPTWTGSSPCHFEGSTDELDMGCDRSNVIQDQFYTWTTHN